MKYLTDLYKNRFPEADQKKRRVMWQAIYDSTLKKFIPENSTVMDIGAGKCELLNIIDCKTKFAVDLNPDVKKYATKGIHVLYMSALDISSKFDEKVDVVILSHFLEHLNSKDEVIAVLQKSYQLLKTGGKVIILQPNIDLVKEAYWDFIDHKMALNTKSLIELLDLTGFKIDKLVERFLPYTTKSNFPISKLIIYLYFMIPEVFRPFAGQTLIIGIK